MGPEPSARLPMEVYGRKGILACMETMQKVLRVMTAVSVTASAVISVFAGCRIIRNRVSADFHYRKVGRRHGYFRVMEFGWHMRRGGTEPIRVMTNRTD